MTDAPFPFIVGRGRSGSTLLRAMLDSHPQLAIPPESHFVVRFGRRPARFQANGGFAADRFLRDLLGHWRVKRWEVPEEAFREAFAASLPTSFADAVRRAFAVYARHHGKPRYADKTPNYVMHLPFLAGRFPEARFVHLIRDGRDVALSYLDAGFGPTTVGEAAIYWRMYVERGRSAGRRLGPGRYREIRYEDLVEDPEASLNDLCPFLDLEFDPAMLRYFHRAEQVMVGLARERREHRNIHLPPTRGLRDWRRQMPARDVALFEALAGELLEELGYERGSRRSSPRVRLRAGAEWARVQARRASRRAGKRMGTGRKREDDGAE